MLKYDRCRLTSNQAEQAILKIKDKMKDEWEKWTVMDFNKNEDSKTKSTYLVLCRVATEARIKDFLRETHLSEQGLSLKAFDLLVEGDENKNKILELKQEEKDNIENILHKRQNKLLSWSEVEAYIGADGQQNTGWRVKGLSFSSCRRFLTLEKLSDQESFSPFQFLYNLLKIEPDTVSSQNNNNRIDNPLQREIPQEIENISNPQSSYLMLKIETSSNVSNGEPRYLIQAWFTQYISNNWEPILLDIPKTLDNYSKHELKPIFTYLINKCRQRMRTSFLVIECFVPRKLLSLDFECWEYEEYEENTSLTRVFSSVHIRCAERINYPQDLQTIWRKKWEDIQKEFKALDIEQDTKAVNDPEMYFSQEKTLWANLCTSSSKDLDQLFKKVLKYGIPVAIWSRCHTQLNHRICINDLVTQCKGQVLELPGQVRLRRKNAPSNSNEDPENLGHHLSLLWDNPNRLPPSGELYINPNP